MSSIINFIQILLAKFLFLLILALLFCCHAFYNKFPIVTSDSGAYINAGYINYLLEGRPMFYGYFLKFFSFKESLWNSVLVQSFILVFVLNKVIKICGINNTRSRFLLMTFIAFFTSASVVVSQLMADIATPIMLLCIIWILFEKKLILNIIAWILLTYSISCHNSNVVITLLIIVLLISLKILNSKKGELIKFSKIGLIVLAFVFATGMLVMSVYKDCGRVSLSKGGNVFMIAKLLDDGLLKQFLNQQCDRKYYPLCNHINNIPQDAIFFLWDYQNSPLYKDGNNMFSRSDEYSDILKDFFKSPKYLKKYIIVSLYNSVKQLCNFQYEKISSETKDSSPYVAISNFMDKDLSSFSNARQYQSGFSLNHFDLLFTIVIFASLIYLVQTYSFHSSNVLSVVVLILFSGVILNAITMGYFNGGVFGRLEARVIWFIPLAAIVHYMAMHSLSNPFANNNHS